MPLYHCRLINFTNAITLHCPFAVVFVTVILRVCVSVCVSGALRRELHRRC
jgi:hypothetical protein